MDFDARGTIDDTALGSVGVDGEGYGGEGAGPGCADGLGSGRCGNCEGSRGRP